MQVSSERYEAWLFAIRLTAEILLGGNRESQIVYAHLAPPQEWQENVLSFWSGQSENEMTPKLSLGGINALRTRDDRDDHDSPEAQTVWEELWPKAASAPHADMATRLASHIGLSLTESWVGQPNTRFARWSRLFCAAVDGLPHLERGKQWVMWTTFHGGRGTYYLQFARMNGGALEFALSEEGHIAMIPASVADDLGSFNIRPSIDAGMDRETVGHALRYALERCARAAQTGSEGG